MTVTFNGTPYTFSNSLVQNVIVDGNGGNDSINVDPSVTQRCLLNGNDGNDSLQGGSGGDLLYGGPGNDSLRGGLGSDFISGGDGVDTVFYDEKGQGVNVTLDGLFHSGTPQRIIPLAIDFSQVWTIPAENDGVSTDVENVIGTPYNDSITGNASNNMLSGRGGNDSINGLGGNDVLSGGDGNDKIFGGAGNDQLWGNAGNDSLYGQDGNDSLWGGAGSDFQSGGAGYDFARYDEAGHTPNVIVTLDNIANDGASGENDNVQNDIEGIFGGAGNDVLYGNEQDNTLFGMGGNDVLYGFGGNDNLNGGDGNDSLFGGSGNNVMHGNGGDDVLRGETGSNQMFGDDGNDSLFGGTGNDSMNGGTGDDQLISLGGGSDVLTGGTGVDSFWADNNPVTVTIFGATTTLVPGDIITDADNVEYSLRTVNQIGSFANAASYTQTGTGFVENFESKELLGQNLNDPAPTTAGLTYKNFSSNPLFNTGGPNVNDIKQGLVGDCWFLSTLSGVARRDPLYLQHSIVDLGDSTYAVRLNNWVTGKTVYLRVDGDLPVDSAGNLAYARLGTGNSTWAALMEKAYTWVRGNNLDQVNPFYNVVNGGFPEEAAMALGLGINAGANSFNTANDMGTWVSSQLLAGQDVVLCTPKTPANPQLVGSHCYLIYGAYKNSGGQWIIQLRNPWGTDGGTGYNDGNNDGYVTLAASAIIGSFTHIGTFTVI
jgi:Ca2+-binding RTX toxin-like protein